ncbi:hypothetical protein GCM10011576_60900 [Micromonospora parathelypteridis]|uniref:Uncharacterized protein n=1 Tax=Micromonospora parathelypteridis TaxID=1839617 RepID=A0A840VGB4_9ACTN|nr:hypothetical protein [Micromonospora parathelypteridis]GGO31696.1 hypothetical protein GCM10011576_60900 [Micromonospora parathelypteridis]
MTLSPQPRADNPIPYVHRCCRANRAPGRLRATGGGAVHRGMIVVRLDGEPNHAIGAGKRVPP